MSTDLSRLVEALSDRYRIERELAAGGMATVYLAHGRDVAIKVLHPDLGPVMLVEHWFPELLDKVRP